MKIYFCEKCGVSIPLQEVVGGRATARDGKTYCRECHPDAAKEEGDLELYFCDNCKVSIPLQDVITNRAKSEGDQIHCAECSALSETQRSARRDRVRQQVKEKEESRYRLHFCDSCNTSIPQSHLVTGRAVVRGGRTFCERCRTRAERRGMGAGTTALVVVFLAVVFVGGYVALGGPSLLAGEAEPKGPDPQEVRIRELEASLAERDEKIRLLEEADAETEDAIERILEKQDTLNEGQRKAAKILSDYLSRQVEFKTDVEQRLGEEEAAWREIEEKIAVLATELAKLKERRAAAPPPVEPESAEPPPVEPVESEPEKGPPTLDDAPAEVRKYADQLDDQDAGVRFSAAVELGSLGHKGAAPALIEVLKNDDDTFVRRAAARAPGTMNAWHAVPALIDTLMDKELFVAITASRALETITEQDFGFREGLSKRELRKVVSDAREWWEEHEDDRED